VAAGRSDEVIWLRPERSPVGRPAERSRAEITAAAVTLADRDGLDAVSMRRVAGELGTGAASLYRYMDTRDDLLDLMIDSTAAEYVLAPPSGDWLADMIEVGLQARAIMHRHLWLTELIATRPTFGPHGIDLLEHVLHVLEHHPATGEAKLEAFAMLNAMAVLFVQNERAVDAAARQRQVAYLYHAASAGRHPQLAALIAGSSAAGTPPSDRYEQILRRVLAGLLDPETTRPGGHPEPATGG
jgi:AcrR family transcriptional regulator